MKKLEQRVPNLRFKGFTDDWEQRKLGKVACINPKTNIPDNFKYVDLESVVGTSLIKAKLTTKQLAPSRAQRVAKKGDIFYQTVRPYQKNNFLFDINNYDFQYVFSTGYAQLRSEINNYFLFSYLQRQRFVNLILRRSTGTSYPAISSKDLSEIKIIFPRNSKEQENIGKIINLIDALITLQQRKLDLLKQLKKGLLQKMFAEKNSKQPVLRFKGFHDDWEGRKLENSADYIRGSFPQPYGNKEWYGGTNAKPFVQVVDVSTNMRLNKKTKEQISVLAQPKSRFVPSDSIVVTLQGSIGRVAITQYDSYVDRTLLIFTKYKVPVDKYFWAYSIQNIFRIEKQKAPGGTIKTITKRALSSFEVSLPVQEEQKKIGTLLKNIDDIITSQQEEVSKLKKIKKSLLQQMFI